MGMFDDLAKEYAQPQPSAKPGGMFDDLAKEYPAPAAKSKAYKGSILPFSVNEKGEKSFDMDAGVLGIAKNIYGSLTSAAKLPGDVYYGDGKGNATVDLKSPEGFSRVMDLGFMAGPMNPAVRAGDSSVLLRGGVNKAPAPTTQALKDAGGEGFDKARAAGAEYSGDAIRGMAQALRVQLENKGIMPEQAPAAFAAIRKLEAAPLGSTTDYARVKAMRDMFNNASAANTTNLVEAKAGKAGVKMIDDLITAPPPGAARGAVDETAALHGDALKNYAAGMRSEKLQKSLNKAELAASSAGSGMNLDNALRQKAKAILGSDKQRAGYNKTEIAALEQFIAGTAGRETLRKIGNMLGGGGGIGSVVSGGAAAYTGQQVFGPAGQAAFFLPGALGMMVKGAQNKAAVKQFKAIDEMVRQNAPLLRQHGSIPGYAPTMGRNGLNPMRVPGLLNAWDEEQQ